MPSSERMPASSVVGALQCVQSMRTRRCAITPMMLPAMMSGRMPRSSRRGNAPSAELVCSVVKTWWPVIAARNAISAVSLSRTSPTRMMSGSWRIIERMPLAKSIFAASLTEVWRIMRHRVLDRIFERHDVDATRR